MESSVWLLIITASEGINIIISFFGLLISAGLFNWAHRRYRQWRNNREQLKIVERERDAMFLREIAAIRHQVSPNGGSSLNDKITGVADKMTGIENTLSDLQVSMRSTRDIMDIASWESDADGRITYVSFALCEMLGVAKENLMDNSWTGLVIPEDRHRIYERWMESVRTASTFDEEYTYKKPEGRFQKVRGHAIHNKNKAGKVINSLGRIVKVGEPF